MSSEEEESDAPMCDEHDVMGPKKKKPRLLHRRNLRAVKKGLDVNSFNVDTLTTHTEEFERIERLAFDHFLGHVGNDVTSGSHTVSSTISDDTHSLQNGNKNGIIILSDSDDDCGGNKTPTSKAYQRQSSSLKYSESLPLADGRLVINLGHPSNEQDIHLPSQIALAIKPHQVRVKLFILCLVLFVHRLVGLDFCMITL